MNFRKAIGNRIYGCDECLIVCPWNKFATQTKELAFIPRSELNVVRLETFLDFDLQTFKNFFKKSPIKRIGRIKFIRNVLIAIGNSESKSESLTYKVVTLFKDHSIVIRASAVWALSQIVSQKIFLFYRNIYYKDEDDTTVLKEWDYIK